MPSARSAGFAPTLLRAGRRDSADETSPTLRRISEIGKQYGFEIGNIFHAGDGNLHPIVLFDPRDPAAVQARSMAAAR